MSRVHLTRGAVAVSVCALLAVTTAGAAAALTTAAPRLAGSAPAVAVPLDGPRTAARHAHPAVVAAAAAAAAAVQPAPAARAVRPVATGSARPATSRPAPRTVSIRRYTDSPGSQRAIDACRLVLWTTAPFWLAGHNYCGYQWLASVPTGTVVAVTGGRAAGRYLVTGHLRLSRQSGALPRVRADLVLQTCVGRSTGLTLARRVR